MIDFQIPTTQTPQRSPLTVSGLTHAAATAQLSDTPICINNRKWQYKLQKAVTGVRSLLFWGGWGHSGSISQSAAA